MLEKWIERAKSLSDLADAFAKLPVLWKASIGVLAPAATYLGVSGHWLLFGIIAVVVACAVGFWVVIRRQQLIPLAVAARKAFEDCGDSIWRDAAKRWEDTPEGRLNWIATRISLDIQIYGKLPPSERPEPIPMVEFRHGNIVNGATALRYWPDEKVAFVELCIKRKDLRPAIRLFKE